ncbi:MAG: M28 family peptidase [Gemmatimonadaceae bacterium]|nr:M28 family peptidase [Gemmatimonadaceae bacterium]
MALLACGALAGCGLATRDDGTPADPAATRAALGYSGDSALGYIRTALAFGTRVPGSEGHTRTGDWLVAQMKARGAEVVEQRWSHTTADGKTLPLRNILARFNPQATTRILYLTHWDTRPKAESDPDPANKGKPIAGANDGTSGIGLFLALADALRKRGPQVGVDLLFVDGEDYGEFNPTEVDVLLGSTYFAANPPSPGYTPVFAVLWDMIGDRNLQIYQETLSLNGAPEVVARVWRTADELGLSNVFIQQPKYSIRDDHVPLLAKGWRAIDVIDIDYPPHHTLGDTIDKLSAASLQAVGDVALALIRDFDAPVP